MHHLNLLKQNQLISKTLLLWVCFKIDFKKNKTFATGEKDLLLLTINHICKNIKS